MDKKEKRIAVCGFVLSIFLFLCEVMNLFSGHIGAAVSSFGAGLFFFALSSAAYKKAKITNNEQ